MCSVLPALHALSGADYTSKFGTKKAALNSNPIKFLEGFGTSPLSSKMDDIMKFAEEYLVQLPKKGTTCKTLDEFRLWKYVHGKNVQIHDLPPTSSTAMGHLLRAFLHTNMQIHCLNENSQFLDPLKFGFEIVDKAVILC